MAQHQRRIDAVLLGYRALERRLGIRLRQFGQGLFKFQGDGPIPFNGEISSGKGTKA